MLRNHWKGLIVIGLFILQSSLFFIIPFMGSGVFLSPDETANAVASRAFGVQGSMRIEDPILKDGPWLRPRSFVTQGSAMVPVTFLGLPILLGSIWKILGEWGLVLLVPLLVLSVLFPFWRFLKRFGFIGQVCGCAVWLSFPTVILYANRGLYPNLPVICFTLWSAYLLWERRMLWRSVIAGLLFGLAIAIRPVEIVWTIPWVILAWMLREERSSNEKQHLLFACIASFVPLIIAVFVAQATYGHAFSIGYLLKDSVAGSPPITIIGEAEQARVVWHAAFGFHPRNVWFNVKSYIFGAWLPWVITAIIGAAAFFKKREGRIIVIVGAWTLFVCAMIYGQTIYQDHVGVNVVSTGNSFVRYLLPLVPFFVISMAACAAYVIERSSEKKNTLIAFGVTMIFAAFGMRTAFAGDAEGVLPSASELARYGQIRATTRNLFDPQTIILSERSDKIFFPAFRVASPLPSKERIRSLVENVTVPVAYYSETVDEAALQRWHEAGLDLQPVFVNLNQTMYTIVMYAPITTQK